MKPKLTLRDLFWLALVCAMGCGWAIEHQRMSARIQTLESVLSTNDIDFSFNGGMDGAFYSDRK